MRKFMLGWVLPMLAFAVAFPLASPAKSATYLFSLSGPNTASFALDSSPTPAATGPGSFTLLNVAGMYNGSPTTFAGISFFDTLHDGGFSAGSINLAGPQLFTGTLQTPTFQLGTFSLCDCTFGTPNYTLSISAGTVPESSTWTMMLTGFGLIGLSMRRRLKVQTV